MKSEIGNFILGMFAAAMLLGAYNLVHDKPDAPIITTGPDCIPDDQGVKAIITIGADGNYFCEKHPVLGYAETNIPALTCPVAESPDCGVE